jgi:nucleoside-diphosphate-sugar epimerase
VEGYLGSVIAPYLLERGYEVQGLDTGFFRDALLYPAAALSVIQKDARNFTKSDLKGIDAVVHLAGISLNDPFGGLPPEKLYDPTRAYARDIARLCKQNGVRFIFASSCSIYGTAGPDGVVNEDSPVAPPIEYAQNKLQIENDLCALADDSFMPIALRFATAFGLSPRMRFDIVINMLVGQAIADGKITLNSNGQAWRPNVHVQDIAQAVECALRASHHTGLLVLNVGADENNMKIIDIAKIVSEETGAPLSFSIASERGAGSELITNKMVSASGADARNYRVSFARIKKYFPDFSCRFSIHDGIREMAVFFKKIKLSPEQFRSRGFYRIKELAGLFAEGAIDSDLFWVK